ncbi:MAG TPA: asparagine synthase-related protein [bacterium]
MSGIAGLWNQDGAPADPARLARLSATLAHRGPAGEGRRITGAFGAACWHTEGAPVQPVADETGSVMMLDGRLDNREELISCLPRGAWRDADDAALALAVYRQAGPDFAARLLGDFACAVYDPVCRRLTLARDAIGLRPLYYCRTGRSWVFASEIKALLAHPGVSPVPEEGVLADFLINRRSHPTKTCFSGVFSVPPAHQLTIDESGARLERYWDFSLDASIKLRTFQDYVQAFRALLEQAVRRRLRTVHPVAVSVSGGLDSSAVFSLAERDRRNGLVPAPALIGLSYISPLGTRSDETAFLKELERRWESSITRIPVGSPELVTGAAQAVWHLEVPFLDEQWGATRRLYEAARDGGARVMLTGQWADHVLCPMGYLADLWLAGRWRTLRAHLEELPRWVDIDAGTFRAIRTRAVIRRLAPDASLSWARWVRSVARAKRRFPWYAASLHRAARAALLEPGPLDRWFPTAHARSVYEEIRSPYHVLCMEWNNKVAAMHGMDMACPFLDRDLVSFMMAIPGEIATRHGVFKALLREALAGVLPDPIRQRRWKADFTEVVNTSVRSEYASLANALKRRGLAARRGYVHGPRLQAQLEMLSARLADPNAQPAWALADLLGLESWLGMFFDGAPAPDATIAPASDITVQEEDAACETRERAAGSRISRPG